MVVPEVVSDLCFRKISDYHEENALGRGGQDLSNAGEIMSILVAVIITKVETVGLKVEKRSETVREKCRIG